MNLQEELKKRNIQIVRGFGMDKDGLWEPISRTIFINGWIFDKIDFENTLLHEFAHCIFNHQDDKLCPPQVHIKQEAQADDFMVEVRAEEYIESLDGETEYINIYNFLELFHFGNRYYDHAERIFRELLTA